MGDLGLFSGFCGIFKRISSDPVIFWNVFFWDSAGFFGFRLLFDNHQPDLKQFTVQDLKFQDFLVVFGGFVTIFGVLQDF